MRSAGVLPGEQAAEAAEAARKAEEGVLSVLKRYAENLSDIDRQGNKPDEKRGAVNALKVALAEELRGIKPEIDHLADRIEKDERVAVAEGAEEARAEGEGIEIESEVEGAETADQPSSSFALDCTALEAIHITVAALTTSPLGWDFNLLRLVQLLIADLKRSHKVPVHSDQAAPQADPASEAIAADATVRAVSGDAAKSAGPQSEIFTPQFVRDSFPKPFIAQLQRLHDLAYDRFAYSDNAADRKQVSTLPRARCPVSLSSERWPLPCNLEGYKSHALNDAPLSESRIKAIQLVGLQQLREQAEGEGNETLREALDSLQQRTDEDDGGKAEAEAKAFALEELAALEAAATSEIESEFALESESQSESESESESASESPGPERSILREAWAAVIDWAQGHAPQTRRDALIQYAKQGHAKAADMLRAYLYADFSEAITAAPGEALFAALESLANAGPFGAKHLAEEAVPVIITEMASDTDTQKQTKGQALLLCAVVAEDYEALKTALLYLNGEEIQAGGIQMPQTLTRTAYQSMYEVLSSQVFFSLKAGPVLRQHLLEQYLFPVLQLGVSASDKSEAEEGSEVRQSTDVNFELRNVELDNNAILASLRALYKRYKRYKPKEAPSTKAVLAQARKMLEAGSSSIEVALFSHEPFAYARALKALMFSAVADIMRADELLGLGKAALNARFREAASYSRLLEAELMLYLGVDVNAKNQEGNAALYQAAMWGRAEVVHTLLCVEGVDVNLQTQNCYTALHGAASRGQTEIVHALLRVEGINVNLQSWDGHAALHSAAVNGHTEIIRALLCVEGIDVNLQNESGQTALHTAAKYGHAEAIRALLSVEGIDVNLQDNYGNTALHWAVERERTEVISVLLGVEGLDLSVQNNEGKTVLELAERRGMSDIVSIFEVAIAPQEEPVSFAGPGTSSG